MKIKICNVAIIVGFLLSGCANMTEETKQKWGATGTLVASKAAQIALGMIADHATSKEDKVNKANWLDYGALLARAQLNSNDISNAWNIWMPKKTHWQELASDLEGLGPAEDIAVGLNKAAAEARK